MPQMKLSYKNGRTVNTLGHHRALLRYLGMDVPPMGATLMGAIARKMVSMTVMGMMTGHMALAVERLDWALK